MRYTEYEFKLDHVFDFIRLIFSSVFLAPFRLVNEISKKVIYLDKFILEKIILGSAICNIVLIIANIATMIFNKQLSIVSGHVPLISEIISLVLIGVIYYIVFIYEQPILRKSTKKTKAKIETKERVVNPYSEVLDEEELISDDNIEDVMQALDTMQPKEVKFSDKINLDDDEGVIEDRKLTQAEVDPLIERIDKALGHNVKEVVANADTAMFREDEIQEVNESCERAIETDEFGIGELMNSMQNDLDEIGDLDEIKLPGLELSEDDILSLHLDDETPIEL